MRNKRKVKKYVCLLVGCLAAANVGAYALRRLRESLGGGLSHGGGNAGLGDDPGIHLFGSVGRRRHQRRGWPGGANRISHLGVTARLIALVALFGLHDWWNPFTWWQGVNSAYQDVEARIRQWVVDAINAAIGVVDWGVDNIEWALNAGINLVGDAANSAWNFAAQVWDEALWLANTAVPGLANQAWGWVQSIWDDAQSLGNSIWNDAYNWYESAIGAVNQGLNWVQQNLFDPLWQWVQNAGSFVWGLIDSAWQGFYADVVSPIESVAEQAWHDATAAWDWITGTAWQIVQLSIEAEAWLVWFAENPPAALTAAGRSIQSAITLTWAEDAGYQAEQQGQQFVEEVQQWLGV